MDPCLRPTVITETAVYDNFHHVIHLQHFCAQAFLMDDAMAGHEVLATIIRTLELFSQESDNATLPSVATALSFSHGRPDASTALTRVSKMFSAVIVSLGGTISR